MSRIGSSQAGLSPKHIEGTARPERGGRSVMKADFEKAAVAAGVDSSKLKDIEKRIQSQLKFAQANPGSGFSLPDAINSALKESGADLEKFHAIMQQLRDQRQTGRGPNPTPQSSPAKSEWKNVAVGKVDVRA